VFPDADLSWEKKTASENEGKKANDLEHGVLDPHLQVAEFI
jgi:hypothetical protein